METYFSTNTSFRVVETDFLASTNHCLYIFQRLLLVKAFFRLAKTYFSPFEPVFQSEKDFFFSGNRTLFETLFLIPETITDISGKQFLKEELILASGK